MIIMAEHNFERRVRQEMSDLKIDPSDAVWENVKIRIEKKKERRRLLIIFFLLGLLLLGGGYIMIYSPQSIKTSEITFNIDKEKSNDEHQATGATGNSQAQKNTDKKNNASSNTITTITPEKKIAVSEKPKHILAYNSPQDKRTNKRQFIKDDLHHKTRDGITGNIISSDDNKIKEKSPKKINEADIPVSVSVDAKIIDNNNDTTAITGSTITNELSNDSGKAPLVINADVSTDTASIAAINTKDKVVLLKANDTATVGAKTFKAKASASKNKWHIGLNLGGGISHIGTSVFSFEKLATYDYVGSNASNATNIPVRNFYNRLTPAPAPIIKSSSAYFIGLFIERELSSATALSMGINYANFAVSSLQSSGYYSYPERFSGSSNKSYRNNFNFIEIPLELKVQLGKGKKMPLYWHGGASLSSLFKSNALQYNPYAAGNYYKDNSLFNNMQLGINTGLSIQLFKLKSNPVTIGPYVYYALSALAKEGLYDRQHFLFTGLRTQLLFKRK